MSTPVVLITGGLTATGRAAAVALPRAAVAFAKRVAKVTVPMGPLGLSEELANAIVFIASDEASFITGHVLNVDGGKTAG
jgi:NAD(P)-dependent dehydrogenase (short-subunit alcohol dehydrogenase family)